MATILFDHFDESAVQKFIDAKCVQEDQDEEELINDETWQYNEDFDACVFDEDKMMTHILDCYASLCAFQQYRRDKEQSTKLNAKTQQAKNKAFKMALSFMSRGMTNDDAELPQETTALSNFVKTFPDDSKQTDGRGWMPLHWAMLALGTSEGEVHGLSEEDVKLIYAIDPPALQRFHGCVINYEHDQYTPLHLLCMQPVRPITMSLLRYFSMSNVQALINNRYDDFTLLHAACELGQPTEEILQHLLQLDGSKVAKTCRSGLTPLQYLCGNNCCDESLLNCLLQFDSSAAVVGGGIQSCFNSTDYSHTLAKVDFLLKVNPEAAQHRFDASQQNLLHSVISAYPCRIMQSKLCSDIMKMILTLHPDAVKEANFAGELPVHLAAKYSSIGVMDFLLSVYPESATIVTVDSSSNLLHQAVSPHSSDSEAKVRYLCSRYPEFIHQRNYSGKTPLHLAVGDCLYSPDVPAAKLLCAFRGGQALVRVPTVHPTTTTQPINGWLPLHFFVASGALNDSSPLSEVANFFRMMLRWYPEAAGIEAGTGRAKKTPYQLAVDERLDPYYRRLLLRAAPDLNPAELHRLNFAERRMAMFMAFRAITTGITPLLMARLRFENKDLVKHVVSFL